MALPLALLLSWMAAVAVTLQPLAWLSWTAALPPPELQIAASGAPEKKAADSAPAAAGVCEHCFQPRPAHRLSSRAAQARLQETRRCSEVLSPRECCKCEAAQLQAASIDLVPVHALAAGGQRSCSGGGERRCCARWHTDWVVGVGPPFLFWKSFLDNTTLSTVYGVEVVTCSFHKTPMSCTYT